ncbi:hypothetical protein GCM10010275_29910 [Streptomyces litmocidini]|uniref:hypothetical protein n=1 Tax=Streptomyces litmocidini TaxID=67318 RepID=UPI00167EC2DA|nr:hypothetical protein [Streptomyces litmocidini]GGU90935.1 hypothetical protein GCM10010275_29910 [Streptomyces litmocidini]
MASSRLSFVLDGRDNLSRVFDRAGDAATRMSRRVLVASINSDAAVRRFANNSIRSMAEMDTSSHDSAKAMEALRGAAISLAPAAIPIAAAFAPIAVNAGAAGLAVGAFGAALAGQIGPLGEAAEAEKKYTDTVAESGARSEEAIKAQADYVRQVGKLPPATRQAAAALSVLKDEYKGWSDSLAEQTMAPVTKSFAVLGALLPKLTPLAQGASHELDRLVTVIGGAVASPGFDSFANRLDGFATGAIRRANDALIHLMRTTDSGQIGGAFSEFMDFARAQGPVVADTLRSVATALLNVLQAGTDVGVGMLTVVNGLAGLVAAVPPGAITALLQLAIAIKAVRLAAIGLAAGRAALAGFATTVLAMRTAAAGASGPMATLTASFGALSRGAKLALAGTGIGLFVIALSELSQMGRQAPPDVDQLTLSLKQLNATGQATGEAAKTFGSDLGGLYDKVRSLTDPSTTDDVQQFIVTLGGLGSWDSTPVKDAKDNLDAIDQALASLVSSGRPEQAAAALERLTAEYGQGGRDTAAFTGAMDAYQSALADSKFEQDLAAASMGLFGQQAVATKAKLDAQKASADGLRQSLQALNDVNRAGLGGQIAFEAALDATAKAAQTNAGAWGKNASTYNLATEKGRAAATALSDLAAKTDAATAAARESGASWSTVNGIYDRGRTALIASAQQMGLSETAARNLANQILRTPDKTARLKGNMEDLQAKLNSAKAQLGRVPDSRKAQVRANIAQLEAQLAEARRKLAAIDGTVATASVMVTYRQQHSGASDFTKAIGGYAGGGDPRPGEVAWVGENGPELVRFGRGGAHVYDHDTSMGMLRQLGAGQDVGAGLAAGMLQSRTGVEQAARGMAAGVEAGVRAELQIASPSKKMIALAKDTGRGMIVGLTGTKAQIKATAMDLVKDVWAAWKGQKTNVDNDLVKLINRDHAKLQALASKRDALRTKLGKAQELLKSRIEERDRYSSDIRSQARSDSGLSSLGLEAKQVTASSIKQGLGQKLAKLRQFTKWVGILTKRGINRNLLRQVLAMGPEEGYAYASALVGMSNADLKAVNSLQSQIDKESDTLGKNAANTMYGAGVASAQGLVAGLKSQEKAVVDQMYKLAKAMEKAIKKALGIRSPSRVAHGIGLNFGQGLSGGTLASLPLVGRAVDTVAGRMAGIRPMAGASAGLGVPAAAGGGSPVYITVQGAVDPVSTAKQIRTLLLKDKRTNGGKDLGIG